MATKRKTYITKAAIDAGEVAVAHGDYQRIADLTLKPDGTKYTADYVRKVVLGLRHNEYVDKKALQYLKRQQRVFKELVPVPATGPVQPGQ